MECEAVVICDRMFRFRRHFLREAASTRDAVMQRCETLSLGSKCEQQRQVSQCNNIINTVPGGECTRLWNRTRGLG